MDQGLARQTFAAISLIRGSSRRAIRIRLLDECLYNGMAQELCSSEMTYPTGGQPNSRWALVLDYLLV